MCNNADREKAMVTIATDAAGKPTVWCDPCLAQIVTALNEGGLPTVASCCGHGTSVGSVALADGRWVVVMEAEDWATFDNRRALSTPPAANVHEALGKAWDEVVRTAGAYGHEDTWTHDMTPYSHNPYRGEARS